MVDGTEQAEAFKARGDLVERIARACHEANSALCVAFGHDVPPPWERAADWQRESAKQGVLFALTNPQATPEQQHAAWHDAKIADGWQYGPVKDAAKKEHPCLVAYSYLPQDQKAKDHVFKALVTELARQADAAPMRFEGAASVRVEDRAA